MLTIEYIRFWNIMDKSLSNSLPSIQQRFSYCLSGIMIASAPPVYRFFRKRHRGGLLGCDGRCALIWVDWLSPSFLRPRLLHLEEATPGEPESSSIVSRWLLDAWEICEQLFRRGLLVPRGNVTWRHVLHVVHLVKRGERKHMQGGRKRERKGGRRERLYIASRARMQIRDVRSRLEGVKGSGQPWGRRKYWLDLLCEERNKEFLDILFRKSRRSLFLRLSHDRPPLFAPAF